MSYDEHLISMAGGDGDVLDQIAARIPRIPESEMSRAERDRATLIARVREQRAVIERVKALHVEDEQGKCAECTVAPFSMHSVKYPCPTITALTATEGSE